MFPRSLNLIKSNSFFLFGARGVGKTTLLEDYFSPHEVLVLDLLNSELHTQLEARPGRLRELVLQAGKEWVVIDEVQKVPPLLDEVHSLIESNNQRFALTGSSARKLKRGSANLLAGRAFVFNLFPLTHIELGDHFQLENILTYGSLPKIFELQSAREKILFLKAYGETYLKEEILIEQLIRNLPPFRKFLGAAATQDTELVSYSSISRDILVDPKIVKNYYSILEDTLLGFLLEPFHTSLRKRQKNSPKFYWFDLGVRRALTGNIDYEITPASFEFGALFESFIVNEIRRLLSYSERSHSLSFVRIDENLEVDLVIERPGLPTYLIEIKSTDRVHEAHVKSLKKFSPEIKGSVPVLLSRDPISKNIDGVSCFEWRRGLREIGVVV
jgi:predicted AAA+ superfamily ATPase